MSKRSRRERRRAKQREQDRRYHKIPRDWKDGYYGEPIWLKACNILAAMDAVDKASETYAEMRDPFRYLRQHGAIQPRPSVGLVAIELIKSQIFEKTGDWPENSTVEAIMDFLEALPANGDAVETQVCGLRVIAFRVQDETTVAIEV